MSHDHTENTSSHSIFTLNSLQADVVYSHAGVAFDTSVVNKNQFLDHSMMLAIGSTFACTYRIKKDGAPETQVDSSVLYKRSVVLIMNAIRSVCASLLPDWKKHMELFVRVEAAKDGKGRLWAILDLKALPDDEVRKVKIIAQAISEEMYETTQHELVATLAAQISPQAFEVNGGESGSENHAAGAVRAENILPVHLAKLVAECSEPDDSSAAKRALQLVIAKGRVLRHEMSKSSEMENLDLRFGDERLMRRDEMPRRPKIEKTRTHLEPQIALLAAVNFEKYKLTLLLEQKGGLTCELGYNDAEHGMTIGEALMQAHRARSRSVPQVDPSTGLVRVRVVLIEESAGDQQYKYHLDTIETT